MAINTLLHVLNNSKAKKSHQLILLRIADHINSQGLGWLSYSRLARETGLTRQWVIKCIADLVLVGELEVIPGGGPHGEQAYRIPTSQLSLQLPKSACKLSHQKVVNSVDPNLLNTEPIYCQNDANDQNEWLTPEQAVKIGLTPGTRLYRKATGELPPEE